MAPRWAAAYTALVALALLVGEAVALVVLATESPGEFTKIVVGAVLALGGLAILGPVLFLQANTLLNALPDKRREKGILKPIVALFERCLDCAFLRVISSTIALIVVSAVVRLVR